jgi:hypothetical protein
MTPILLILILLQIKHWYVDFVQQTDAQVKHKGIYGHPIGMVHSGWQGAFTAVIFWIWLPATDALFLGLVDFFLHYHIDYVKMHFGNRDITTKAFWAQLGLDQLAHQLTYIFLIWYTIGF